MQVKPETSKRTKIGVHAHAQLGQQEDTLYTYIYQTYARPLNILLIKPHRKSQATHNAICSSL